jgi:hypothetical protein
VQINSAVTGLDVAEGETIVIEVGTFGDALAGSYALEVTSGE